MPRFITAVAGIAVALSCTQAQAAIGPDLDRALADFKAKTTPAQAQQMIDAISASPPLERRMNRLAASGKLKTVELIDDGDPRMQGVYGARILDCGMAFTAKFLVETRPRRLFDVVRDTDILPNNLIFVLGHLSYHLDAPFTIDGSKPFKIANEEALADESKAFIQGWNDLIDGETAAHKRPLTVPEGGSMLINLLYRAPFERALSQKPDGLHVDDDGHIQPSQANVKAFAAVLGATEVMNFE